MTSTRCQLEHVRSVLNMPVSAWIAHSKGKWRVVGYHVGCAMEGLHDLLKDLTELQESL